MKIAFESQLFLKGDKTGIGWCADNLIKELVKDPDYQCVCDFFTVRQPKERTDRVKVYEAHGAVMNPCKWFHNMLYKLIWPVVPVPYSIFFGKDRDITQFFNFVVPPGVKGKVVTIVHDMAYKAYPETVNERTRKWLELTLEGSCRRADAIITVSEFSKREIMKYLGVEADKITVMPNGVNLELFHNGYTDEDIDRVKQQFHIQDDYFLYLGTLEPRKNIERIIQAYYYLLEEKDAKEVPELVLAGGKGWLYDSIFELVHKLNMEKKVIFTGYVEERDVPVLMQGARAFLFPSLYEGFGMPPLEAMACQTPVITSNTSSLPEVVGEAGILVDPFEVNEIKEAMKRLAEDVALAEELGRLGLERSKGYTWEHSADILKQVYQTLR